MECGFRRVRDEARRLVQKLLRSFRGKMTWLWIGLVSVKVTISRRVDSGWCLEITGCVNRLVGRLAAGRQHG